MMAKPQTNVLIVDDDVNQCRTLSMILRYKGYDVDVVHDGCQALETVRARPFDVIVLDIRMPQMDGVETQRRIRKIRPHAMVMMMTAYAGDDAVQQAREGGARAVLYKPVDVDHMLAKIEACAGRGIEDRRKNEIHLNGNEAEDGEV
jgi:CheY-like chemotaxis protein